MPLSTPGIGSGLDIGGIVDKLMSLERAPVSKVDAKIVELQSQVSAYGSLKSAISTFRDSVAKLADISKFKVYSATSSSTDVLSASASSSAAKGVYNIEVLRIAENHRMAAGTTYADTTTTAIGTTGDTMAVSVGDKAFTVATGGKTLADIRDAINGARDNSGVTASIIKDDVGYRLTLSASSTGSSNLVSVAYSGTDQFALQTLNTDRDSSGGFTKADLDASVKLENSFTITSSTNSLSSAIDGVALTLVAAGKSAVNVSRDISSVQGSVQAMTRAYSTLVSLMGKMRVEVLKSDTSAVSGIESQLRAALSSNINAGNFTNAFQLGISTQKNGTLAVDNSTLANALNNDFDGVAKLFADPNNGLATRLAKLADSYLVTNGVLDGRAQGLDNALRDARGQKSRMEQRLIIVQARLTKQYNALDSVVSGLQRTGNLVTQQLDALTNAQRNR